ncbi:MAG: holo-ACP synthase [Deltaproteobacteria bacterium]|nr:holo-ACP synthase [Deltaproteobacteria bacterium]
MIRGIGTDMVAVSRIAAILTRHGRAFVARVLGPDERKRMTTVDARALARTFAAKEAVVKAMRRGLFDQPLRDIQILDNGAGRPRVSLSPELASAAPRIHLDTDVRGDIAAAVAVVEEVAR